MQTRASTSAIERRSLLTAIPGGLTGVERVEITQITLPGNHPVGLHLHPCPVVGYVVAGSILFQVADQPARVLHAGDAFFEPAQTPIPHFDNATAEPAIFVACYLLGAADQERIIMLPQPETQE